MEVFTTLQPHSFFDMLCNHVWQDLAHVHIKKKHYFQVILANSKEYNIDYDSFQKQVIEDG